MNCKPSLPIIQNDQHAGDPSGPAASTWWRSLEELARSAEFEEYLQAEFPADPRSPGDPEPSAVASRRDFLHLMAASLALAGAAGCEIRQPRETIVPMARRGHNVTPGLPEYFTTAMEFAGFALGLTVESRDGRPIKVEGNPNHPTSLGTSNLFAQALTLDLYDPDRLRTPLFKSRVTSPKRPRAELDSLRSDLDQTGGQGLRLLATTTTSPTVRRLLDQLTARWPRAQWSTYEPFHHDSQRVALQRILGQADGNPSLVHDLSRASVILSIDCDFLGARDYPVCYVKQFSNARRVAGRETTADQMVRLYHLGPTPTLTSSKADHPLAIRPGRMHEVLNALAGQLTSKDDPLLRQLPQNEQVWVQRLSDDLRASQSSAVVMVGHGQPTEIHSRGIEINRRLGAFGKTVHITPSPVARPQSADTDRQMLGTMIDQMEAGEIESLILLGGNPAFDHEIGPRFAKAMQQVPFTLMLTEAENETSRLADWVVPQSHVLESWGDVRAHDGTVSIVQPLIAPLYPSQSVIELLSSLLGEEDPRGYAGIRNTWSDRLGQQESDPRWHRALAEGVVPDTAFVPLAVPDAAALDTFPETGPFPERDSFPERPERIEKVDDKTDGETVWDLIVRPDPTVWDGRFSNNGWLQELPKPLSHVVWDNTAWLGPADASRLNVNNGDVLSLSDGSQTIAVPAWIVPGQADGSITLFAGYGREVVGRVGKEAGVRVMAPGITVGATRVQVRKTGQARKIVTTQHHQTMNGRHLARSGTRTEFQKQPRRPDFAHPASPAPDASMYSDWQYSGHKWGMTIDLTACVGCSACVIACQAENNIPVVGKQQCDVNRHMHWIRVDTYYQGSPQQPDQTLHQPVPCMHCEQAPCEVVCPVAATNHSGEGLNQMVYNRCVGTRYCSNNCPYKVRRFNFLDYSDDFLHDPTLHLLPNPEVTVRSRGVMEKCTYCVQRIERARIAAQLEERELVDGEIRPACQSACPAQAIRFGDLNDANSAVRETADHPLNYGLLEELNTKPRTTYLAEVTNPKESEPPKT